MLCHTLHLKCNLNQFMSKNSLIFFVLPRPHGYRWVVANQSYIGISVTIKFDWLVRYFFYYLLVWTIKNLYDGKTELVLFRSRIYIYLCNRIGLGHPLNHRKTITLHLGMPGTLDSCPSIPSFLDHQLRKTENRWIYLH